MKGLYLILLSFLFGCNLPDMQTGKEVSYYFDQPAQIWEETLPLGNGRIGMMPDGGIERENVVLNEISLWSGSKQDTDNPYAYYSLANIRRLLFEGRNDEAQDLMYKTFVCKGTGSNLGDGANAPYGSYQLFGNLVLRYTYPNESDSIAEYRRRLNLSEAIASVSFKTGECELSTGNVYLFFRGSGSYPLGSGRGSGLEFLIRYESSGTCDDLFGRKGLADAGTIAGRGWIRWR